MTRPPPCISPSPRRSAINIKILLDDQPHALGSLLLRLAVKGSGDELLPILRLMESNRQFANEMPKFKDTRGKGLKIFKGKAGKGAAAHTHDKGYKRWEAFDEEAEAAAVSAAEHSLLWDSTQADRCTWAHLCAAEKPAVFVATG